jgi:hypothetical protein
MFKLSQPEKDQVFAICDHLKNLKYAKALPNGFTEHGAREKYLKSGMGKRYLKNRLKRFLSLTG